MRHFILLLSLSVIVLTGCASAEEVCSVHDGDTFTLCSGQKIRLFGIDAPELKQPMGHESRDALTAMVQGASVSLSCPGKSYNRLVCRVSMGKLNINSEMVRRGWAFDSPKYSYGAFKSTEAKAKAGGVGVWVLPDGGQRPWVYRSLSHGRRKKRNSYTDNLHQPICVAACKQNRSCLQTRGIFARINCK